MTDVYKKVGRGGAGNFYSKKDIEDVSKEATAVISPFLLLAFLLANPIPLTLFPIPIKIIY
jgi:hypothetical protein